jgi:small-conductance mechanosensitive channel
MLAMLTTAYSQAAKDSLKIPNPIQLDSSLYNTRAAILLEDDSIFMLYEWVHGYNPSTRAKLATERIYDLVHQRDFEPDSFHLIKKGEYYHINYQNDFIVNIGQIDADWTGLSLDKASQNFLITLKEACIKSSSGINLKNLIIQISLAILVIVVFYFVVKYINKLFKFFASKIEGLKGTYLKGVKFGSYEFIGENRLTNIALIANNIFRIAFLLFLLYLTLPILFSIFPWTEGIAKTLFAYVLDPIKSVLKAIIDFIPSLFKILVIFFVFRYIIKGVKFLSDEVEKGKLVIPSFYPDWAKPTTRIISFILYVFMFVLIWPLLPGSDSEAFKGVSVFLGILISLGSSTSIANIMAGLVITYMRPFRVGDRVKVGEVSGDILEKNLLVTRVRTIKNEIITIPNSMVLNNASTNFTMSSEMSEGLVLHTSITIGYDVPWRLVHSMLLEVADKTPFVEKSPAPFVLQTSLDDFYVSYQLNAYTKQPAKQSSIYSDLHALMQDVFAKNDVEIMSPHYQADREGPSTIPPKNID